MINPSPEESSAKEIELYRVDYYYCPQKYTAGCQEMAPGRTFEIEVKQDSDMKTYYNAFQSAAEKNAPLCPVHSEKMLPLLRKV
ncbi:MAG: hypothetical protein UX28_C0003G0073 [Candidatus Pacebacteria bacterium GW2011_GWA1_46_10]|nr:MAG: hypothetical protein UX28_C0003G0073 [Candidatus Pacebacteria bacterium GW2011_GWA1_46_10]HCR81301.1 hypothetical protein [Candidatus Paceibacterota bacterium]